MLQIKIANTEEVNNSREEWNSLVTSMKLPTVFLTWEWITTWLKHFGSLYKPLIIFIYDESVLRAIVPLCQRSIKLRTRLLNANVVSFCGSIELYPDHLDIICAEQNADEYVEKTMDFLFKTYTKWDALYLPFLADDGYLAKWLHSNNKKQRTVQADEIIAPYINIEHDFESFLKGFERKKRYNLMREKDILFKKNISLTKVSKDSELRQGLEELFSLHKARIGIKKITSAFTGDAIHNFHSDISRIFLERGCLGLYLLKNNDSGKAISAAYGFVYEKRFHYYQTGLDPDWMRYSPGKLLIYKILEDMYGTGITAFDFLGGNDSYKTYWTKDRRIMRTYSIFNSTMTGSIEYWTTILLNFAKSMFNRRLRLQVPKFYFK